MSKEDQKDYIEMYQNRVQVLANIVDPNKLFAVAGRGLGKTSQITAPRILRVAQEMPRELSIISHKSFVALFTNVIPTVLESFRTEITMPDGTVRKIYFYCVDISEFTVNKLTDRGSLSSRGIVTNAQDFIVNIANGLGV